jgi:hypothetical protein
MQSLFGKSKKGMTVSDIGPIALVLGIAVLIVAIVGSILAGMQTNQTADTVAYNVTGKGLEAMGTFGGNFGTIALVVGAAIVIGVLVTSFRTK